MEGKNENHKGLHEQFRVQMYDSLDDISEPKTYEWDKVPSIAGVYHVKDLSGDSLYVGQSKNVKTRLRKHKYGHHGLAPYLAQHGTGSLRIDVYPQEECEKVTGWKGKDARKVVESDLACVHHPKYTQRALAAEYWYTRNYPKCTKRKVVNFAYDLLDEHYGKDES